MARYNEEIFQCQCPAHDCRYTEIIFWHHCGDIYNSGLYLSDTAMVRCGICGFSSPFFENKYDCGKHNDTPYSVRFRYPNNLKWILAIIGALEDDGIYSSDFANRLSRSLVSQYNNKNR